MAWVWSSTAALGIGGAVVAWTMAAIVYGSQPRRLQNRVLALVIAIEGIVSVTGSGLMYLTDRPNEVIAWQACTLILGYPIVPLYLLFLSTIDSPLSRPLAHAVARWTLVGLALITPFVVAATLDNFILGTTPAARYPYDVVVGPWFLPVALATFLITGFFGLFVAVSAFLHARPGTTLRNQMRTYTVAFGLRDLGFIAMFATAILVPDLAYYATIVLPPVLIATYLAILAYGILRYQMFDIELRIKKGIRRGTFGAAFVLAFLVGLQLMENLLDARLGIVGGAVAAGLLLFAARPLERFAFRVADTAMPNVKDSPAYLRRRQEEVYRHALEAAFRDEHVTRKERALLVRLADDLGLSGDTAHRLERDVLRRLYPT